MASQPPVPDRDSPVPRTRAAGLWIASILFAVVLLLLLIFILLNTRRTEINFFGTHASPPIGVALLLAAVFGILLVALPGTARILQLRLLARRRAMAGTGGRHAAGEAVAGRHAALEGAADEPLPGPTPSLGDPPTVEEQPPGR